MAFRFGSVAAKGIAAGRQIARPTGRACTDFREPTSKRVEYGTVDRFATEQRQRILR
jgi:hypothetical protein